VRGAPAAGCAHAPSRCQPCTARSALGTPLPGHRHAGIRPAQPPPSRGERSSAPGACDMVRCAGSSPRQRSWARRRGIAAPPALSCCCSAHVAAITRRRRLRPLVACGGRLAAGTSTPRRLVGGRQNRLAALELTVIEPALPDVSEPAACRASSAATARHEAATVALVWSCWRTCNSPTGLRRHPLGFAEPRCRCSCCWAAYQPVIALARAFAPRRRIAQWHRRRRRKA
jgi:hypothetical protein